MGTVAAMHDRITRAALAVVLVATLLAAAACGTGGDDPASGASPTSRSSSTTTEDGVGPAVTVTTVPHDPTGLPTTADGTFDPDRIDLSDSHGVSEEEIARAEDLLRRTVVDLPHWSDSATAEAEGYVSFGDASTGDEHLINWDYIEDDAILDPTKPEALVYSTGSGGRVLEAAMFMLPSSYTLANLPPLGGDLTQFHVHRDLCVTPLPQRRFAGLRTIDGPCSYGEPFPTVPMVHVWIRPHPCGPFAALEGIGGGQIADGQQRSCHHEHG